MGLTDTAVMITTTAILFILGVFMPFIVSAFSADTYSANTDAIVESFGQIDEEEVTFKTIVISVSTMFFWTYGIIQPYFWIEMFLELIRIAWYISLFRTLRGN